MQWEFPAPFTTEVLVTDKVIDELNHTNNAEYVKWCEHVAWLHSHSLGLGVKDYLALNRAMAIVKAEYQYIQATNLHDELVVGTWLTYCDQRLSCDRAFQIIRKSDNATVTKGKWQLVCIDIKTGKPKRMPKVFVDTYSEVVVIKSIDSADFSQMN